MSHSAKAIAIHCMDFRFVHETVHFFKHRGLIDQYDDVSAAGGAKNLVDPTEAVDRDFILRQIEIAKRLHGITQVYLINHRDCGAYGKIFDTPEAETERHTADLRQAKSMIQGRFSDLEVKAVLASLAADGHVGFEEISG